MQRLREPFQGYTRDKEQLWYWRMDGSAATIDNSSNPYAPVSATLPRHLGHDGVAPVVAASLYNPNDSTGAKSFDGASTYYQTHVSSLTSPDGVYLATSWSLAFWYNLGSAATQTIVEYARGQLGLAGDRPSMCPLSIKWLGLQNRFMFGWQNTTSSSVFNSITTASLPSRGWLGIVCERSPGSAGSATFHVYHSTTKGNLFDSYSAASLPITPATIGTSNSHRWLVGASRTDLANPIAGSASETHHAFGSLDEMVFYPTQLSASRMRSLYASTVRDFSEDALLRSGGARMAARLLVEDTSLGTGQYRDLSNYHGANLIKEITITESVDDLSARCEIVIYRTLGRLMNLGPVASSQTVDPTSGLIDLRKRIIVEKALFAGDEPQGWEWEHRFDGFIDAVEYPDESTLRLICLDSSVALIDAEVLEPRGFNFFTDNEAMEEVQQHIIDTYVPKVDRNTIVGYRGGTPIVYTPAGSTFTPLMNGSQWMIRFHDVSSGAVWNALQGVADEIGFDSRYRQYAPLGKTRLETYGIRRNLSLVIESAVSTATNYITVRTAEPHGLAVSVLDGADADFNEVEIFGTSAYNLSNGQVSEVVDDYTVVVYDENASGIVPGAEETTGSLTYQSNYCLPLRHLRMPNQLRLEAADIRNYAVVRFARQDSTATRSIVTATSNTADSGRVRVTFQDPLNIDPDDVGFDFTLALGGSYAGTAASIAGSYTGRMVSATELLSDQPTGLSGNNSTSSLVFESSYLKFNEVRAAYTPSIRQYGLRPAAVYEGSNGSISSRQEAVDLAERLVSDLAYPPIDFSIQAPILPVTLGDMIGLPLDPKRILTGPTLRKRNAVVRVRETYSPERCYAEYGLRRERPVKGRAWGRRILVDGGLRLAPVAGATKGLYEEDSKAVKVRGSARGVKFNLPELNRNQLDNRVNRIEMHASTDPDFIPSRYTLAAKGVQTNGRLEGFGNGDIFQPGQTYYIRLRELDVFGNPTNSYGLNAASAATVPSVRVRYLEEGAGVVAVSAGSPLFSLPNTAASHVSLGMLTLTDGSDPKGVSYVSSATLAQVVFSGVTLWGYRAPVAGTYRVGFKGTFTGDAKPSWGVTLRAVGVDTDAGLLTHDESWVSETVGSASDFLRMARSAQVFCASGTFLSFTMCGTASGDSPRLLLPSTACTQYASLEFQMITER